MTSNTQWEPIVVRALANAGGSAHLSTLYREVEKECLRIGRPVTTHFQAKVRQVCQRSERIVQDEPKSGVWRLARRPSEPSESTE